VTWTIRIGGPARRDLRRLDRQTAARVLAVLDRYAETGQGDLIRLKGKSGELRLRVGDWRVRFTLDHSTRTIDVLSVRPRGRAYRE
jgi:mRNA interferase RelE/StbE